MFSFSRQTGVRQWENHEACFSEVIPTRLVTPPRVSSRTMAAIDNEGEGFDAVLGRLRKVVERLENGNLSLEESLAVYEEGVGLAARGHLLLDGAEKRVELLIAGGS